MSKQEPTVKPFRYVEELDAFVITDEFRRLADTLGLTEWHPAVWLGRLFTLDNDFGEHWLDNWGEREVLAARAKELGLNEEDLMAVVADRFRDGRDGPCHPPELRRAFWTDVLKSLAISYELLFAEARLRNEAAERNRFEEHIEDLEERIAGIRRLAGS